MPLSFRKDRLTRESVAPFIETVNYYGEIVEESPILTVQVVTYNEGERLLKCLSTIANQSYKHFELVVVDNGLDDKTKDALKEFHLTHLITKENLGCSQGRNIGAPYSNSELIAFIDADGDIPKDYIKTAVQIMKNRQLTAVRGKVLVKNKNTNTPSHYNQGDATCPSIISTEGNSVWRLDDFLNAGGYEQALAGGEGAVLCYRMVELYGYDRDSFVYNPNLILYHDYYNDLNHLESKMYRLALIRDSIDKRYPLLTQLTEHYVELLGENRHLNARLGVATDTQKLNVRKQYAKLYMEKLDLRWNNPTLVKGLKEYDFTVVIPHYNLGSLVVKAVESVMHQSIDSVQIIVVDDASTNPNSLSVLKGLEDHVQVIYQDKNAGVAATRNIGIEHAKSENVLCLDADDTIEPCYLEKAYNLFEMDNKIGIVSTWVKFSGQKHGTWRPSDNIDIPQALINSPVPTASCFRRITWQQVGGYDETMRGYEDWNLWISILKNKWKIRVIPEFYFNYLVRVDGKVSTSNRNIGSLVGRIVDNHVELYERYYKDIFIQKHKDITELRYAKSAIESQTLKNRVRNSFLGKPLKITKRVTISLVDFIGTCIKTRNPGSCVKLFAYNIRTAIFETRKNIR